MYKIYNNKNNNNNIGCCRTQFEKLGPLAPQYLIYLSEINFSKQFIRFPLFSQKMLPLRVSTTPKVDIGSQSVFEILELLVLYPLKRKGEQLLAT